MNIAVFEVSSDERAELDRLSRTLDVNLRLVEGNLSMDTLSSAEGCEAVSTLGRSRLDRELLNALRAMGVHTAYDPDAADLSAMLDLASLASGQHFLDTVLHKTYIAVDEKGTEAAAVTAAMCGAGAEMPSRPALIRTFTADGPFWFVIRDNAAGEILFAGRYETAN